MASTGLARKVLKDNDEKLTALEETVGQALLDLEQASELKSEVRALSITTAREVDVGGGRSALLIFVPYRLLARYHRVHARLVRELEKKFSDKHVVIIGRRRILPKERHGKRLLKQKRPRSRTLTAVHEAYLDDVVYPTDIVGKRVRYRPDQSRLLQVHLDPKDKQNVEARVDTYAVVYKHLTGKEVVFEFPDA